MNARRSKEEPLTKVYELEIALFGIAPRIWRRFAVPGRITLAGLHDVIQCVMGWTDSHLHEFIVGERHYTAYFLNMDWELAEAMIDEETVKVHEVVNRLETRLRYIYDFGDGWQHELEVKRIGPSDSTVRYPTCLAGERACPPEDCGGVGGYEYLLEVLSDPSHDQHEELLEWVGGQYDPELFDLRAINRILRVLQVS